MKKSNGTGSITKLSGKRRKPWMARLNATYELTEDKAIEKRVVLGYFATKKEAQNALDKYYGNPYNVEGSKLTVKELYEEWIDIKDGTVKETTIKAQKSIYNKHISRIDNNIFADMKLIDFNRFFESLPEETTYKTMQSIVTVLKMMGSYAFKNDYITKDYTKLIDITKYKNRLSKTTERYALTDEEIDRIKVSAESNRFSKIMLISIYSGLRLDNELFTLKRSDIHLSEAIPYIDVYDSKNVQSTRKVPIHSKVLEIVKELYEESSNEYFLVNKDGNRQTYHSYYYAFRRLVKKLNIKCTPYDTRHTFTTRLKEANVNYDIVDRLIGHQGRTITDSHYTHYSLKTFKEAIEKV